MMALSKPDDMPDAFAAAWMARDAAALARLFVEDADFVNVVGIWWHDRPSIEKAHDYALRSFFSESRLTVGRTKLRKIGEDAAVVHARLILTGQIAKDGGEADRRATIISFVMERRDDGWMCVAAHNTDIVPGAETFEARGQSLTAQDYRE